MIHDHPQWSHDIAYGPCTLPLELRCDNCNGTFAGTTDRLVLAETDSQIADHEFEPQETDPTRCDVDGWDKIEHDLNRALNVHESCFLDRDDILVRL